jgi:tetratricopeptide (TPR) repeat protein
MSTILTGRRARLTGLAIAAALALASMTAPVLAADTAAAAPPACDPADPAQVARDEQVVKDAMRAFSAGGFAALKALLPDLQKVVSHAPGTMHRVETCDGRIIIHADSMAAYLAIAAAYPGQDTEWRASPYPRAALLAGSVLVEYRDYAKAVKVLMIGVRLTPDDGMLVGEAAGALNMSGRFADALDLVDRTLAAYPGMPAGDRARLLRAKGFAFGEMKRFDEAEAAYTESLRYEPGNPVALNELRYIASQRQGAPPAEAVPVDPATGKPHKR